FLQPHPPKPLSGGCVWGCFFFIIYWFIENSFCLYAVFNVFFFFEKLLLFLKKKIFSVKIFKFKVLNVGPGRKCGPHYATPGGAAPGAPPRFPLYALPL
ncbi:hypothetical protein, partial [Enterobacter hormaechei]